MNIWTILDIEPTNDVTVIKKAYARKLKITQPEDNPEGFQLLREAYDCALKHSKSKVDQITSDYLDLFPKTPVELKSIQTDNSVELDMDVKVETSNNIEDIVEDFINNVCNLYDYFFARIKVENWELLLNTKLNQDILLDIDMKQASSDVLLNFLMEHKYLPRCIWKLFDNIFNWRQHTDYLYKKYPKNFIDYIIMQIDKPEIFHYCYFNVYDNFDFDKFLECKEKAYYALLNKEYSVMADCIKPAYEMCPDDPDILRMLAEFHLSSKDNKEALNTINRAIYPHPDFVVGLLCRAKIYIEMKNIESAIKDCNDVLLQNPYNIEAFILIAESYFKSGNIIKAKKLIKQLYNPIIPDNRLRDCLSKFNDKIIYKIKWIFYECAIIFPILFTIEVIFNVNIFSLYNSLNILILDVSLYILLRILWLLYSIGKIGHKYKYINDEHITS